MKKILVNYNFTPNWLEDDDYIIYDRSDSKKWLKDFDQSKIIYTENKGSDIYDKFGWIIDNYDNLPDIVLLSKSNIFKYITPKEFDLIKNNTTFTPILTKHHLTVMCDSTICEQLGVESKRFSYYENGIYHELNYPAFLKPHPTKNPYYCFANTFLEHPLYELLGIKDMEYVPFAPGSSYILTSDNIRQNSKEFYQELRSHIGWKEGYSGEDMILERGLYTIFKPRYN